jgi:hypothetical protein
MSNDYGFVGPMVYGNGLAVKCADTQGAEAMSYRLNALARRVAELEGRGRVCTNCAGPIDATGNCPECVAQDARLHARVAELEAELRTQSDFKADRDRLAAAMLMTADRVPIVLGLYVHEVENGECVTYSSVVGIGMTRDGEFLLRLDAGCVVSPESVVVDPSRRDACAKARAALASCVLRCDLHGTAYGDPCGGCPDCKAHTEGTP